MEAKIKLTEDFKEEAQEIYDYIYHVLKNPQASKKLRKRVVERINNLKQFPKMYKIIKKKDKLKRHYRRIDIDNYIILYSLDEIKNIVYVTHIYYGKRNYIENLL